MLADIKGISAGMVLVGGWKAAAIVFVGMSLGDDPVPVTMVWSALLSGAVFGAGIVMSYTDVLIGRLRRDAKPPPDPPGDQP